MTSYLISPRDLRAKLSCARDLRIAQANMAKMDAEADAADLARERVIRIVKRQCWERYSGYSVNMHGARYTVDFYDGSKIKIDRDGNVDWGSFVFQQAAE